MRLAVFLLGLLGLALVVPEARATTSVKAHLEPEVVRPDGTVQFTLEAEGEGIQQPRLRPRFDLENLELVGGPDQTHGLRLGLGIRGWHYSWTWYLRPRSEGWAAVTSIRLLVGDREIELPPQRIRVASEGSGGASRPRGLSGRWRPSDPLRNQRFEDPSGPDEDGPSSAEVPEIFVRAVVEPPQPYVGQRTLYTAYLYTRVRVDDLEPIELPRFEGCWARDVEPDDRRETVEAHGVRYRRVPLYRRALYPLRAGTLDLGVVAARLVIERIERDRRYFAPVRIPDRVVRRSNRIELKVRPLPEPEGDRGVPFDGAIGPLELTTRLEPSRVQVGRGATLTVTAKGEGHMEALRPPPVSAPEGIEVLGPHEADEPGAEGAAGGRHRGTDSERSWSYLLVPRRSGSWGLAPIEAPWFDPVEGRYRIATSDLPRLHAIRPGAHAGAGDAGQDLHPIRSAALPGPERRRGGGLLPWAFGIPWVVALALLAARRRGPLPIRRVLFTERRGVPAIRSLHRFRRELQAAVDEDRPRRAASGVERAWRHFLAEILGIPDSTPTSGWPDELERRGASADLGQRLKALLEDLHFLRYAPELSDAASLAAELTARSEQLAREIVRLRP